MSESSELKSLNDSIASIQSMLDNAKLEVTSFDKGNKSAAARARKSLQNVKNASHETRKSIMSKSKAMKLAKKTPTPTPTEEKETEAPEELQIKVKKPRKKKA